MRKLAFCLIFFVMFLPMACVKENPQQGKPSEPVTPKVTPEKEKTEKEPPLPPEVKIRLKKDGKDSYSWELSSSDVDQILKVNEKLRKKLGGEQSR